MLSQRVHWWGKIKKPLNSAIANNEPSSLKLQQALIGFKVMKKTTWSIIIKARCRHVRARALCCDWRGRAPSTGARTGPCPWGNHPSSNINISETAAPEAFTLILKYSYDQHLMIKLERYQPDDGTDVFYQKVIVGTVYDYNGVYSTQAYYPRALLSRCWLLSVFWQSFPLELKFVKSRI